MRICAYIFLGFDGEGHPSQNVDQTLNITLSPCHGHESCYPFGILILPIRHSITLYSEGFWLLWQSTINQWHKMGAYCVCPRSLQFRIKVVSGLVPPVAVKEENVPCETVAGRGFLAVFSVLRCIGMSFLHIRVALPLVCTSVSELLSDNHQSLQPTLMTSLSCFNIDCCDKPPRRKAA